MIGTFIYFSTILGSLLISFSSAYAQTGSVDASTDSHLTINEVLEKYNLVYRKDGTSFRAADGACYFGDERNFIACMDSVNSIGVHLSPPKQLIPRELLSQGPWQTFRVLEDYGGLVLAEGAVEQRGLADWEKLNYIRLQQAETFKLARNTVRPAPAASDAVGTFPIPFGSIALKLKSMLDASVSESSIAMEMAQDYESNFDAHFHLEKAIAPSQWSQQKPGVQSSLVEYFGQTFGYIRIPDFLYEDVKTGENTCTLVSKALKSMEANDQVGGYIIDLRNNSGGLVFQAVCIAGLFVGNRPVLYERKLATNQFNPPMMGKEPQFTSDQFVAKKPLVILINGRSMSMAEVLPATLQGLKRAYLVGTRTFGKATEQNIFPVDKHPELVQFKSTDQFYEPVTNDAGQLELQSHQRIGVWPDFYAPQSPMNSSKVSLQEGDLYPFAVPAANGTWKSALAGNSNMIEGCASRFMMTAGYRGYDNSDFQLSTAEQVLACQLNNGSQSPFKVVGNPAP